MENGDGYYELPDALQYEALRRKREYTLSHLTCKTRQDMKATEIQIGDWVTLNGVDYQWQWTHHDFTASEFGTLSPIPLTPEILEKNIPFERYWDATRSNPQGSVTEWRKNTNTASIFVWDFRDQAKEYILEIHIKGIGDYRVRKNIYSVHELQHALRLCGLNELADSFRVI